MEKYTIETSGKKITNLSAEDVVKHYQNKVTTELIGSLASTEYPETFADAEEVAQDFGDTVTKVEPTKDNTEEGGKAEFADGDESAQNFNGCPDCDKMLSKASTEKEEVVVIDLDGKILSWVDDEHVDFLDTVDEPDGGKAKAVKFEDEIDVKETMETVGYSDEEYEILPVSKAFAFVEEGEE